MTMMKMVTRQNFDILQLCASSIYKETEVFIMSKPQLVSKVMTQNANGAVTNRQENTQLFSEGSLPVLHQMQTQEPQ